MDLLKTLAYSWYSSRMAERSISSEIVVDLACIVERNWRENVFEPERREAWSRAGALIIAIWGHLGLDGSVSDGVSCRGFSAGENGGFTKVSTRGTEARLWSTNGGQKDIDPETQSINGL